MPVTMFRPAHAGGDVEAIRSTILSGDKLVGAGATRVCPAFIGLQSDAGRPPGPLIRHAGPSREKWARFG